MNQEPKLATTPMSGQGAGKNTDRQQEAHNAFAPSSQPLSTSDADAIADSHKLLIEWNKTVAAKLHQADLPEAEALLLLQNTAAVAEAIRERYPHREGRGHIHQQALEVYDDQVARKITAADVAKGLLIGTGKALYDAGEFTTAQWNRLSSASLDDVNLSGMQAKAGQAWDTAKLLAANPAIVTHALAAAPATARLAWNETLDAIHTDIRQSMRSNNPGEEAGIAVGSVAARRLVTNSSIPFQAIDKSFVGPIEAAWKKISEESSKLTKVPLTPTRFELAGDHTELDMAKQLHTGEVNYRLATARSNTSHQPQSAGDPYKNHIDQQILTGQFFASKLDRLESCSRFDIPVGGQQRFERAKWLLLAKFSDPMMPPLVFEVALQPNGRHEGTFLTRNKVRDAFEQNPSTPQRRIDDAHSAFNAEWERNPFQGMDALKHAPIVAGLRGYALRDVLMHIEHNAETHRTASTPGLQRRHTDIVTENTETSPER